MTISKKYPYVRRKTEKHEYLHLNAIPCDLKITHCATNSQERSEKLHQS